MIIVDAKNSVEFVQKYLLGFEKQIPYVTSRAINATADDVQKGLVNEMKSVFDRPTPFTLNGVRVKYTNKRDLTAIVWLKDEAPKGTPAEKFLRPQIEGGDRRVKRFERAFQHRGILPQGMQMVPAAGAKLDQYGNISKGLFSVLANYFWARNAGGYNFGTTADKRDKMKKGTKTKYGIEYFFNHGYRTYTSSSGKQGQHKTAPGIWMRIHTPFGTAIKPVILFTKPNRYQQRFDFFGVGLEVAKQVFERNFESAAQKAIATARP